MYFLVNFFVPWITIAASLYTATLLMWLGALVLLGSTRKVHGQPEQHRTRESLYAGSGLLLAGLAMGAHTAMLDYPVEVLLDRIGMWWRPLWFAMVLIPGAWSFLALVYAGFYIDGSALNKRSRAAMWLGALLGMIALVAGLGIDPIQIARQFAALEESTVSSAMLALCTAYAGYLVLCLTLAADALLRPEPSGRILRDLARRRARPYLLGATAALGCGAAAILSVFGSAAWLALRNPSLGTVNRLMAAFDALELSVSLFACVAVACVGKAIASYEIFSGLALPRSAIAGAWRSSAIIFGIFSLIGSVLLGFEINFVYQLLVSTCALALAGAWLAAQADFNQRLYMQPPTSRFDSDPNSLSQLETVLGARVQLKPMGDLAALLGGTSEPFEVARDVSFVAPNADGEPWTIILRRGVEVSGLLLLWLHRPGQLLTEGAVALARSTGERILEERAAAALTEQLMEVQRRYAHQGESLEAATALGGRTRRALHDELLPRLHAALLELAALPQAQQTSIVLTEAHKLVSDVLRDAPPDAREELARFGTWDALQRAADSELNSPIYSVTWNIAREAREVRLTAARQEALFYAAREMLRNIRRYAAPLAETSEQTTPNSVAVAISANIQQGRLVLNINDNGVGLNAGAPSRGGGQGLALHSALLTVVDGALRVEGRPTGGTQARIEVPVLIH